MASLQPDIVIFDESFLHGHVPFGAFAARGSIFRHWNRKGFTTFHSTTFQPNTIASLHFLRCLAEDDPSFYARLAPERERVTEDRAYRAFLFSRLYNPALARLTASVGWDVPGLRAMGHYIHVRERPIFDAVAGVACSIRGHNPPHFRQEIESLANVADSERVAEEHLQRLTGLRHMVPAVSGASAVENALRLGLAAQPSRPYVLAFSGGFGGKTLLALTGTARSSYKTGINPLYDKVLYLDPFQETALVDMEEVLTKYPVGIVQVELIQGVGGVRALPQEVLRYLQANKERLGYLLLVDEVQTAMYRTGPFLRSQAVGVEPDLLTIGKGVSDMMFPFAVTLYSDRVHQALQTRCTDLPQLFRRRFGYEFGYKTLINVLARAEEANAAEHVRQCGALIEKLLRESLSSCKAVRAIRVYGLLIGIELDTRGWPRRYFRRQAGSLYLVNLMRHEPFPILAGLCQYEPHVLKLTPPLSITFDEARHMCETLTAVLRLPARRLLPALVGALVKAPMRGKITAYWNRRSHHEYLER